ncbi:glycosyltransferase [Yinghuangia aomiensis]
MRPTVAANAPRLARPTGHGGRGVRGAAGLPDDVPVLVYSGWLAPERGVDTLAEALVYLPDAHAVVVAGDRRPYFAELEAQVADLGVADRFHFVPYVEPDEVVDHLATATVGVIPLRHLPNHEISLITKYYEYMHAGLPIVVSDVRTMAAFTRDLGCGEVFPAGDARRLAEAVQRVLADRSRYVKPYAAHGFLDEHAWERQADNVAALYERLTGLAPSARDDRTLAREIRSGAAGFASGGARPSPRPLPTPTRRAGNRGVSTTRPGWPKPGRARSCSWATRPARTVPRCANLRAGGCVRLRHGAAGARPRWARREHLGGRRAGAGRPGGADGGGADGTGAAARTRCRRGRRALMRRSSPPTRAASPRRCRGRRPRCARRSRDGRGSACTCWSRRSAGAPHCPKPSTPRRRCARSSTSCGRR